jgi:hypothetical protein
VKHRAAEGAATIALSPTSADGLRVKVAPGLGAKVTSLRVAGGREWLAPPVRPLATPVRADQEWAELDCSGWDECFPNIAASQTLGLLDHGEVWRHPWTANQTDTGVRTEISTDRYTLARELRLSGRRLLADYTLRSEKPSGSDDAINWAWAQHPLLSVDERTRLLVPAAARVRLEAAFAGGESVAGGEWVCPTGLLDTDTALGVMQGRAAKLWFERPLPRVIAVQHDEEWLAWRIDESSIEEVGLWINLGGWRGSSDATLRHLAIEPAFGSADDPELAYAQSARLLPAGGERRWNVVIEAGRGRSALADLLTSATLPN